MMRYITPKDVGFCIVYGNASQSVMLGLEGDINIQLKEVVITLSPQNSLVTSVGTTDQVTISIMVKMDPPNWFPAESICL